MLHTATSKTKLCVSDEDGDEDEGVELGVGAGEAGFEGTTAYLRVETYFVVLFDMYVGGLAMCEEGGALN